MVHLSHMDIFKDIKEEQQRDHDLYFIEDGEAGFSPEHNKFVIENTIKKYNQKRKQQQQKYRENLGERSDAVATYLKHLTQGKDTPVEKYFSKKTLAYLRGEEITQKLKSGSLLGKKRQFYLPN